MKTDRELVIPIEFIKEAVSEYFTHVPERAEFWLYEKKGGVKNMREVDILSVKWEEIDEFTAG